MQKISFADERTRVEYGKWVITAQFWKKGTGLQAFSPSRRFPQRITSFNSHAGAHTKITLEFGASEAHITSVPVETKERREERLVARVSGADKQLFQRAASLEGRSVATFVIAHAREVARRIVADYETIELDAVQSRRFVKALLNPTASVPSRLKKASAAYRQRVAS